jgi:CheY-like chemotaxis protein
MSPPAVKVLIADDNRDASDTLAALLELEGYATCRAYDGHQALSLWQQLQPDACLLDISMPGRSGHEVARAIRALPQGARCLLVAMTGWSAPQASMEAGFDLHLTKPVRPDDILSLLQSLPGDR